MYSKLVDKVKARLNEDTSGGMVGAMTSSGNPSVSYLPGGFTSVKNYLRSLTPLKRQWGLNTIDEGENYRLQFENALDIIVPKTAYDDFNAKILKVKGLKEVNLAEMLNEDIRQELSAQLKRANQLLVVGLKKKPAIIQAIGLVNIWLRLFPKSQYLPKEHNVLFGLSTFNQDVAEALEYVGKLYGTELSKLEGLVQTLEEDRPLNSIPPFSKFEYVVGAILKTDYQGISLEFDLGVNMSLRAVQAIRTDSPLLLEEIQAMKSIKVVQDSIVPIGPAFTPKDLTLLKKIADDVADAKGKK